MLRRAWVSPGNTPARATVEAKLASPDYNVEIMVVRDLVRETEVHRDVYVDQEIFDLEPGPQH